MTEPWIWLFPATYLLHLAEESFAGEHFRNWTRRITGWSIPLVTFMILDGCFFFLMVAAVLTLESDRWHWLLPALGTIIAINGLGHMAGTIATRSYSPGVITGVLAWATLGLAALERSSATMPAPAWWTGVAAGLIGSAAIVGLAFAVSRKAVN
jgi:hypothetical protein